MTGIDFLIHVSNLLTLRLIFILTPIYMAGKKDGVAVLPLFLFPLNVQIHRTADNYQAQHDGQCRF